MNKKRYIHSEDICLTTFEKYKVQVVHMYCIFQTYLYKSVLLWPTVIRLFQEREERS